jgi:hypothetical protein
MILTRYLYVKEEVMISILTSILESDADATLYWAYELYFSGFEQETMDHLFKIYYYLFACQNPDLEQYMIQKRKQTNKPHIIHDIVQTMILRPFDTDVLLLHRIATYLDYDVDTPTFDLKKMSFPDLAAYIVSHPEECDSLMPKVCAHFKIPTWEWTIPSLKPIILLSKCLKGAPTTLTTVVHTELIADQQQCVQPYRTTEMKPAYNVLKTVCRPIDPHHYLAIFGTPRTNIPLYMKIYHNCWLVCAAYSPVWAKRIASHGGTVDRTNNKVTFKTEELEESFYEKYGYEPDEQSIEVQYRNMSPILEGKKWPQLVKKRLFPSNEEEAEWIDLL